MCVLLFLVYSVIFFCWLHYLSKWNINWKKIRQIFTVFIVKYTYAESKCFLIYNLEIRESQSRIECVYNAKLMYIQNMVTNIHLSKTHIAWKIFRENWCQIPMDLIRHWYDLKWSNSCVDSSFVSIPQQSSPPSFSESLFHYFFHIESHSLAHSHSISSISLLFSLFHFVCVCVCVCSMRNKSLDKLMSWSTYWHRTYNKWMGQTSYQISQFPINHWNSPSDLNACLHDVATMLLLFKLSLYIYIYEFNTQIIIEPYAVAVDKTKAHRIPM